MTKQAEKPTFELLGVGNYTVQDGKIQRIVSTAGPVDLATAAKIYAHEGARIFKDADAIIAALSGKPEPAKAETEA